MKNYSLLWIISFILMIDLLSCCSNKSNWYFFDVKGNVRSYIECYYSVLDKLDQWEIGEIQYCTEVSFNEKGQYYKMEIFDNENKLINELVPKYEKSEVIEEQYFKDEDLLSRSKFNHSPDNVIEFETFNKDGIKISYCKMYFEQNKIIKQVYEIYDGTEITDEITTTFDYNELEQLLNSIGTDKEGDTIYLNRFEYSETDNKGNWTRRLIFDSMESKVPKNIVLRQLEYY